MSVQGFSQTAIVAAYAKAQPVQYTYVAAITIVVYDIVFLSHQELEYIYKGRQTLIKWIYILVKLTGLVMFALNFVAYLIPPQTPNVPCATMVCRLIVDTAAIKTLLVLRLRALYGNNRSITVLLCSATAVELIGTTYAYVFIGLAVQQSIISPAPIPGCALDSENSLHRFRSPVVIWAARLASNSFELVLLLVSLYHSLKKTWSNLGNGAKIRKVAPILYVFYRDGTIFYVPVCTLSIFGLVAILKNPTGQFSCANWEAWLGITYYIIGTRLILNIRQAGLKFSTSTMTGQDISSLAFQFGGESTVEGGVSETLETPEMQSTVFS